MSRTAPNIRVNDSVGDIINTFARPLDNYEVSDRDEASSPAYYGYLALDGSWYIMKTTTSEIRYSKGSTDYATNWTNRASLTYDTISNTF